MGKINYLQVYRGIAALLVILFHVDLQAKKSFGTEFVGGFFHSANIGVDFFFVLSGFIIVYVHFDQIGDARHAPRYLLKRLLRFYPLVFAACAVKLGYFFAGGGGIPEDKIDTYRIFSSFLLLPMPENGHYLISVLWTLAHEVLFYLLFLFALLLGKRAALILGVTWALLIVIVQFPGTGKPTDFALHFLMSPCHMQFLLGAAVAVLIRKKLWEKFAVAALLAGSLFAVWCWQGARHTTAEDIYLLPRVQWGIAFALIVFGTVILEQRHEWAAPKGLMLLGDASYSVYLFHTSFLKIGAVAVGKLGGLENLMPAQAFFWLNALLATVGGVVAFYIIERPAMNYTRKLLRNRFTVS